MNYPMYIPVTRQYEPQWHRIFTLPKQHIARVEPSEVGTYQCAVELVHKRNLVISADVYLPGSDELVVRLQAAVGELRRNPQKFVAVVVPADTSKARVFRTVEIKAGVMLVVEG